MGGGGGRRRAAGRGRRAQLSRRALVAERRSARPSGSSPRCSSSLTGAAAPGCSRRSARSMAARLARASAPAAGDGVPRRGGDDGGAQPRRHDRAADADRVHDRGEAAAPTPARTCTPARTWPTRASLLLPVSNLTNLLAFRASGLSFARFAALMALPWLVALAIEWLVLQPLFAGDLRRPRAAAATPTPDDRRAAPRSRWRWSALTLVGFALSSPIGIAPGVGRGGRRARARAPRAPGPRELVRAAEPTFLVFVLALGDRRHAPPSQHGLVDRGRLARCRTAPGCSRCSAIAAVSAVVANLVNNLPATLIILPVAPRAPARGGARDADRRQRRTEPHLRRLAGDAPVAADRPCPRRRHRHRRVHPARRC